MRRAPAPAAPLALSLFGGAGGEAYGLMQAGCRVIIVDIEDHSAAAAAIGAEFHLMDWRDGLAKFGPDADLICAGPPCQRDSTMSQCRPGLAATYPDLVVPVRRELAALGKPWVIEQPRSRKARSKMLRPVTLCGSFFGLEAVNDAGVRFGLQRHRMFDSDFPLAAPAPCPSRHRLPRLPVYGHGAPGNFPWKGTGMERAMREGMGIGWMTRAELAEAIPWRYSHFVASQLLAEDPRLSRFGLGGGWQDLTAGTPVRPLL